MKRIAALLLCLSAEAAGQPTQLQPAETTMRAHSAIASQTWTIPRYCDLPIIQGTDKTDELPSGPTDLRWVVRTAGLDTAKDISEWQETSHGRDPAVQQPRLRDCIVAGYPDASDYHGSESIVNVYPQRQDLGEPDLYGGFRGYGTGGIVDNVTFFYAPGTLCHISRPNSILVSKMLPYDRLKWNVTRCSFRRAYRGCWMAAVDSMICDCEAESIRDWGFRLGGSVMFRNLHPYGVGHTGGTDGEASGVWLENNNNQGGVLYVENCPIGLYVSGSYNQVTGVLSHTCSVNNIKIAGVYNQVSQLDLSNCSGTNVLITAGGQCIRDGVIEIADGQKGIHLQNGDSQVFAGLHLAGSYMQRQGPANNFAENSTAVDVDAQINNCDWQFRVYDLTTGIDFTDGEIGIGNRIWLQTASRVTNPVVWPRGQKWSTTAQAKNESNDIRINGVRWYRQT